MAEKHPRAWISWAGLVIILALYSALATMQSFATRLQWGPDEPAHIIYVRSLALDGRLPALTHDEVEDAYVPSAARTHQAHHPPLYYALASPLWRAFAHRPDEIVRYADQSSGAEQSFVVPGPVRPVRFFSIVLGGAALLCAWAAARTVFPNRPELWLGGVALAAFTPMFTYMSGVINNDPLVTALFAAAAWQWARVMRFGASRGDVLVLGLLAGAGVNAKETGLGLLPLSVVPLVLEPGAGSWRQRAARMGAVLGLAAVLGGWWYVRKWAIYGQPLVYPYLRPFSGLSEAERQELLPALPGLTFLFAFLPLDVIAPPANVGLLSGFFGLLVLASVGGLVLAFARRQRQMMPRYEVESLALWLAAAAVVLAGLIRGILTIDWTMGTSGGRYVVCVLPLLMLASARGLSALFGEAGWARAALLLICLLMLAVNIYAIWATAASYQTLGFAPFPSP